MSNKLLIMPYYGQFPNYFQLWVERIKQNPGVDLLLVTDDGFDGYDLDSPNIHILNKTLDQLKLMIQDVVGDNVQLEQGYKVKDYFPLYGEVFSDVITTGNYEWWGTIDTDVILGNVDNFLSDNNLVGVDRILGNGHFSFFKNSPEMNNLWRDVRQNTCSDLIPFKYIKKFNQVAAYNEYGWRWGKGISTFMERVGLNIKNDIPRADLDFNYAGFKSNFLKADRAIDIEEEISYISVKDNKMFAIDNNKVQNEIMYVHLQKRNMGVNPKLISSMTDFDIFPNVFLPSDTSISNDDLRKMASEFETFRKRRISLTRKQNLFSDYIVLRILMLIRKVKAHTK
ncbi:hypothetical protein FGL80_00365 [Leuconostoc lactis]|uniref:DUF6625 family protein n=1 Tax=Leuconostoc lactis TaxID=1246 RepID=UPI0011BAE882|nr:DUF6625 family protein [Leuconostoc lactis]QEA46772.1 hypothetical protein FGL80_00365 [Leuconostoc lactis]